MTRILVTGASGFVGRAVAQHLAQAGYDVRAAARNIALIPQAKTIEPALLPDLAAPIDWLPLIADVDAVIHLAAIAHAGNGIDDAAYDRVNRLAAKSLALAATTAPRVKKFVFVSSIRAQSGPSADHVLTENDSPIPTDAYGRAKLAAEAFVRGYGVPATILRPVVVYGDGVKGNVASMMRLAASPLPLPLRGLGGKRSLLALGNLVSAIRFVLDEPKTSGETYIVADTTPVTLPGMIAILRKARGRTPMLFTLPPTLIAAALKAAGRGALWERVGQGLVADASKLRAAGWTPPTDTPAALAVLDQAASP